MFQIEKTDLKIYKLWEEAHLPEYGSRLAACFDLKASLRIGDRVTVYTETNNKITRSTQDNGSTQYGLLCIAVIVCSCLRGLYLIYL